MSASNHKDLIERAQRLLKQHVDLYGPLNVDISLKTQGIESAHTENYTTESPTESEPKVDDPSDKFQTQQKNKELTTHELISKCTTLEELKVLCEQSEELKTDLQNTNLVFGVGNPNADLMIIGEAPGENEDRQGEPFVGAAGKLLDKIMKAIDFERSDIYIANILKHRPPNNRDPKPAERNRSLPFLLRQIELINPKLILCVGRVSGTTLLAKDDSLKNMRRIFHAFHGRELMVTYHPAALLRNSKWKRPTWEDIQLLRARYDELNSQP